MTRHFESFESNSETNRARLSVSTGDWQKFLSQSSLTTRDRREPDALVFDSPFASRAERSQADDRRRQSREFSVHDFADRRTVGDAKVYVPPGFDPKKPVNVIIFNHGQGQKSSDSLRDDNLNLKEQMAKAPLNSILIVPAWQQSEGSYVNLKDSKFTANFLDILKTALSANGKTLSDISSIQIVSFSAGHVPADHELKVLKQAGLYDRITTVANLDAHFSTRFREVDDWIDHNIKNGKLARGEASYVNIWDARGGTHANSTDQKTRVESKLKSGSIVFQSRSDVTHFKFTRMFFADAITRKRG